MQISGRKTFRAQETANAESWDQNVFQKPGSLMN